MSTIYKRKNEQGTYIIDDDGFVIITYQDGSTERMAKVTNGINLPPGVKLPF